MFVYLVEYSNNCVHFCIVVLKNARLHVCVSRANGTLVPRVSRASVVGVALNGIRQHGSAVCVGMVVVVCIP